MIIDSTFAARNVETTGLLNTEPLELALSLCQLTDCEAVVLHGNSMLVYIFLYDRYQLSLAVSADKNASRTIYMPGCRYFDENAGELVVIDRVTSLTGVRW